MRNSRFHPSVLILALILALCPQLAASQVGGGAVEISLRQPSGEPAAGFIVTLDGTCQQVVTDTNGLARFDLVAEGEQTWSVAREVEVLDEQGLPVLERFTVDAAIEATVLAGQEITIEVTVEIKVVIVLPAVCKSTPWCGVVGGQMPGGNLRVVTGGGVHGNCPCTFTGGPVLPPACPGRRTVDPAPAGVHTITTTTCLGGLNCALPKRAVTCSITVP